MEITPEQYSDLCDLFEQAWRHQAVDEDPERQRSTSDDARRFANAAMRTIGIEHTEFPADPELLKLIAAYLNKNDPDA